jgi:hypothetical protein
MARRIKQGSIKFVSLCPRGANLIPTIYKADDTFMLETVAKLSEQGELTSIVYAPEKRDSQGDIASAEVIKNLAHGFLRDGKGVDIVHDGVALAKDKAHVAESFIVQKGDDRFKDLTDYNGDPLDATGAWAVVIKLDDPELRKLYRDGKWQGVSMGGTGEFEVEKADSQSAAVLQRLARLLGLDRVFAHHSVTLSGDIDMTKDELAKTLDERDTKLTESIGKAVGAAVVTALSAQQDEAMAKAAGVLPTDAAEVKAAKIVVHKSKLAAGTVTAPVAGAPAAEVKKAERPVFSGDPTDAAQVAKFDYDIKVFDLKATMDPANPESVRKVGEEIAKLAKPGAAATGDVTAEDAEAGINKDDSDEVKTLRRQLHKAEKASRQGGETAPGTPGTQPQMQIAGMSKADMADWQEGLKIANHLNQSRDKANPFAPVAAQA